ncbi:MAG: formyltransferase family protein [Deltaproteobacteria bacterium]|nr:formyltransferase family protein [Deltaproteobacteria bacterium]
MKVILLLGAENRVRGAKAVIEAGLSLDAIAVPPGLPKAKIEETARDEGCEVLETPRAGVLQLLQSRRPDVVLSVGWPYLFGRKILETRCLLLNSHPTLLPKYRGPNPWYHVLANGETKSGVTIHKIDEGMDTGPILHQREFPLTRFDTYRSLKARTLVEEPVAIREALALVRDGNVRFHAQREEEATSYPGRRKPEHSCIDAAQPLMDLVDAIRACDPDGFPAYFEYHGQKLYVRLSRTSIPEGDHPESL